MIGDFAANRYDHQGFTENMDIWIEDSPENRDRLRMAFNNYGMGDFPMLVSRPAKA